MLSAASHNFFVIKLISTLDNGVLIFYTISSMNSLLLLLAVSLAAPARLLTNKPIFATIIRTTPRVDSSQKHESQRGLFDFKASMGSK